MAVIPYAGYEPNEDDYATYSFVPMSHEVVRRNAIPCERAIELRDMGMKWDDVADVLTFETGRVIKFYGQSVQQAVWKFNNRRRA